MRNVGLHAEGAMDTSVCRRWLAVALLCALLPGAGVRGEEADEDAPKPPKFAQWTGNCKGKPPDWYEAYKQTPGASPTPLAQAVLNVATAKGYSRQEFKTEMGNASEEYKSVSRNLDVGRCDLLKTLYSRAFAEANKQLQGRGSDPLDKLTTVNSGGTGDFTRDQDITLYGRDEVREHAFFQALVSEARKMGLHVEPDDAAKAAKTGFALPQLEVAFHRGKNDLPDAMLSRDPQTFALDYRKIIETQGRNPEAYFGYGWEMEVKGRASQDFKPGTTLVQEFVMEPGKGLTYQPHVCTSPQEVRAVLRLSPHTRYRRAQHAVRMANNFFQAYRHVQEAPGELTKGPLKYCGRTIECILGGLGGEQDWSKKSPEDKLAIIAEVMPLSQVSETRRREYHEQLCKALDVSWHTFKNKELPETQKKLAGKSAFERPPDVPAGEMSPEKAADLTQLFMRKAACKYASDIAHEMIEPPRLDPALLPQIEPKKWASMTREQREQFRREKDAMYRELTSQAAMENLIIVVQQLRALDMPHHNPNNTSPGDAAIRSLLDSADPRVRPVLELAAQHADVFVRRQNETDGPKRKALSAQMDALRYRISERLHREAPGKDLLAKASRLAPSVYLRDQQAGKSSSWGGRIDGFRKRSREFLMGVWQESEIKQTIDHVRAVGPKSYLRQRMMDEALELGNITDGLQLIEMYQNDAKPADYAWFLGTNILGRCHWSFGHFIAAAQVKTGQDVRELGKNLFFDGMARLIPGMGTFKLIIDIEVGIVRVTVGYTFNRLNADLVDALYTGRAGKPDSGMDGKVAGQLRSSGFCILDESLVKATRDKAGKLCVEIDQPNLYRGRFRAWTGLDYDEPRRPVSGPAGEYVAAHDALVKLLERQYAKDEGLWVTPDGKSPVEIAPDEKEMDEALTRFRAALEAVATADVDKVLTESAAREYIVYDENNQRRNVIADGLRERLVMDVMTGFYSAQQTRIAIQVMAKQEIERVAAYADMAALAEEMARKFTEPPPVPPEKPEIKLAAAPLSEQTADGVNPVTFVCEALGKAAALWPKNLVFEVQPKDIKPPAGETKLKARDVVTAEVKVVLKDSGGTVLAEEDRKFSLRLPPEEPKCELLTYEEKWSNGQTRRRYTYYKAFRKMPKHWKEEDGEVKHGEETRWDSDGKVEYQIPWRYGRENGRWIHFHPNGKVIMDKYYADGKLEGKWTNYSLDSQARLETTYSNDRATEQVEYRANGSVIQKVTYTWDEDKYPAVNGDYVRFHPNGQTRQKGSFRNGAYNFRFEGGDENGAAWNGKEGDWVTYHANGQPYLQEQYKGGLRHGTVRTYNEKGTLVQDETYREGRLDGPYRAFYDSGTLRQEGTWGNAGDRNSYLTGENRSYYESGKPETTGSYDRGQKTGTWTTYHENGKVYTAGSYAQDKPVGVHTDYRKDGSKEEERTYVDGSLNGPNTRYHANGRPSSAGNRVNGSEQGQWISYWENGNKSAQWNYEAGQRQGPAELYYHSGALKARGEMKNDAMSGPWTEFHDGGGRSGAGNYAAGECDGPWTHFSTEGKTAATGSYREGRRVGTWTVYNSKGEGRSEKYSD